MSALGDFDASSVIYDKFTTFSTSTGLPSTLGGSPVLSVYKDNSTTQSTAGVTITADFDSMTGFNHYAVDTSADGTFYSTGSFFSVVITTGTIGGSSIAGTVVGSFTLRKNSSLKPTTADRTLDVSAGGEAGIDLANVGSPTTTVNLSGVTIKAVTDGVTVTTNSDKTGYALTQSFPTNFSAMSITGAGLVDITQAAADKAWGTTTRVLTASTNLSFSTHTAADVWAVATRVLTAGTNLSFSTHSASDVWAVASRVLTANTNLNIPNVDDLPTNAELATAISTGLGTGTWATAVPWNANWDTEVQSECADALTAYGAATGANVTASWTTAMAESYAANGAAPSPAQALYAIQQMLTMFAISGTSYTVKKLDGSTTAFVITLNDGTAPTGSTRS